MNQKPADATEGPEAEASGAGAPLEELVDLPRGSGETIRTLQAQSLPDGSGNDSADPEEQPDDGTGRYDAG